MREHAWAIVALAALTILGFFTIPGHTYLQSDTQIYLPLLERLWDPALFSNELLIKGQHVSFTIYDEVSLGLRKLTGAGFQSVLHAQQLLFRFCALAGVYLLALAFRLERPAAVFTAACFGLGAWITGPSILTFEYEPVPRGNAVGLTLLAIGLTAHARFLSAGAASAVGFLYQVPAVYPFWGAYLFLSLWPGRRRMLRGAAAMCMGIALLLALSMLQRGGMESQQFFSRIDPVQEKAMRERASYNWVSMWQPRIHVHHTLMLLAAAGALWRLRLRASRDLQLLLAAMLVTGILSVPVSLLLLEGLKWNLIPQIQPARALLYVTALAGVLSTCAGIVAAQKSRWLESAAWFLLVFALPSRSGPIQNLFDFSNPAVRRVVLVVLGLSALSAVVMSLRSRVALAALLAMSAIPYLAIPKLGRISNYAHLHTTALIELSDWARASTDANAVFLFPSAGRGLQPGIFRAQSLRAVYVDWKGGGQINYLRQFLNAWLPRWQNTMVEGFHPSLIEGYKQSGINYIVLPPKIPIPGLSEAYRNPEYLVYHLGD